MGALPQMKFSWCLVHHFIHISPKFPKMLHNDILRIERIIFEQIHGFALVYFIFCNLSKHNLGKNTEVVFLKGMRKTKDKETRTHTDKVS